MQSFKLHCLTHFILAAVLLPGIAPLTRAQGQDKPKAQPQQTDPATLTEAQRQALRRENQSEIDAAVLPYINNFFATTRLGPEDIISVDVFDKPNYSRANITIPPDGVISYPQIGRLQVAGRTVPDIEKEVREKLMEYIIDPQVTVQLVASHSQKIFVVGDVNTPGIYEMTRRMTVTEALSRAGYLTKYGDKKKIHVLRMQPDGNTAAMPLNMKEVEQGKRQDMFLVPGDTIVVPGNIFKTIDQVSGVVMIATWMRILVR
ncbi:MAG: polysaccharide export protein [Acidobacteria bacterium]|nr:polysaccharide export protein [Acidobacteriota bacterium]MBI3427844.1 polysaccharide export protein [Acidobacteriota bacterium]